MSASAEMLLASPGDLFTGGGNPRSDLALDKDGLVDSVREHGVLLPIRAVRTGMGRLVVQDGHRRVAAALEAGLFEVPVFVHPVEPESDDAVFLAEQVAANMARLELSVVDQARAVEQLSLFDWAPERIAKATGLRPERVQALSRVGREESGLEALSAQIPLDCVLRVLKSEDQGVIAPGDADRVLSDVAQQALRWSDFDYDWAINQALAEGARAKVIADKMQELESEGLQVLPANTGLNEKSLSFLGLDEQEHLSCPGHAVYVSVSCLEFPLAYKPMVYPMCLDSEQYHLDEEVSAPSEEELRKLEEKAKREEARRVWNEARVMRRIFLQRLLQSHELPKNYELLVARAFTIENWCNIVDSFDVELVRAWSPSFVRQFDTHPDRWRVGVQRAMVQYEASRNSQPCGAWSVFLLGLCLFEHHMEDPCPRLHPYLAEYLSQLHDWGYMLTPPEREFVEAASASESRDS